MAFKLFYVGLRLIFIYLQRKLFSIYMHVHVLFILAYLYCVSEYINNYSSNLPDYLCVCESNKMSNRKINFGEIIQLSKIDKSFNLILMRFRI